MSKMMLRGNGKPPLARSPIRLRSRRQALQPTPDNIIRTPPGSLTKSQLPNRTRDVENSEIQPKYQTISCELRALATMVQQELGSKDDISFGDNTVGSQRSPLFERGRFYDLYSARRNERLREKKAEMEAFEKKHSYSLGVRVESSKKREANKFDSRRKMVVAMAAASTPVAERREAPTPRYSLRSSTKTANKKLPMPMTNSEATERRVGARRIRKTT
ncbi:hypothetical protein ACJIZ3_019306 [Penstemon smallii]|uniref:Uncharacterized protein n=1 Tax=Penstemon smallii TaxID=265156 RepID=A0ABD3T0T7_9LAMI